MEDYADEAGRLLADRYRLPRPPAASHQLTESVAYDTASGQEVLVRQVPLPEVVEAEVLGGEAADGEGGRGAGPTAPGGTFRGSVGRATRRPADPAVRRALEAAVASARLPDHPRLDQVFDVFVEGDGLWIVSELLPATPLERLLAHQTLTPHRAAEIAADVLTALRVVHAHGWTHRNVTARTVLICDDGRALLTGLAVGAAQEALCGYNPLPDSGREALPPSGSISAEAEPGVAADGPAGPADGGGRGVRFGAGDGPLPALPDGFDVRPEEQGGPYGGPAGTDSGPGAGPGLGPDAGPSSGTGGGPRGIFGQGLAPGHDVNERHPTDEGPDASTPLRHGYETDPYDGPPQGGIAAYQAGVRRGTARTHGGTEAGTGSGTGAGTDDPEETAAPREDWWNRPASTPPAPGPHTTPDDFVRWLPSGEDEVTPTDLPGSRPPNSLPVRATWRPAVTERVEGREPVGYIGDPYGTAARGDTPGDTRGDTRDDAHGGAPGDTAHGHDPYAAGDDAGDAYTGDAPYTSYTDEDPYTGEDPYEDDEFADGPEDRPWGGEGADDAEGFHGPATALAAERARQARMTVVGAVSERWAPEQAGPVHRNWRLAPPVGPSADLWALGVLLFRAVQGHGPYPEDDVAELVQMVCGEPPAFAEECGPLRPVVESLMRQDPTERPDFEELRGWLRSLVRSAPEPEVGWHTVYAQSLDPGGTSNPRRLPILRRRGELVRRRRAARRAARAEQRQQRQERQRSQRQKRPPKGQQPLQAAPPPPSAQPLQPPQQQPAAPQMPPRPEQAPQWEQAPRPEPTPQWEKAPEPEPTRQWEQAYASPPSPPPPSAAKPQSQSQPQREQPARHRSQPAAAKGQGGAVSPRKLGVMVLGLVFAGLVAALAYAVWFMPDGDSSGAGNQQRGSVGGESRPAEPGDGGQDQGDGKGQGDGKDQGDGKGQGDGAGDPRPSDSAGRVPKGYKLSRDPAGFQVAVPQAWNRRSTTGGGQVRYNGGQVEMVLVNGRDSVRKFGRDPMSYQSDHEPELKAYRASDWASTSGLRRIDVGETAMAEGTYSWRDGGREVYARNRAMIIDGRYHVLMVMGSKSKKAEIDRHFEAVADTYRPTAR